MSSLAEEYPKEQARCRELLSRHKAIPTGFFGAACIEDVLKRADVASAKGDVVAMLRVFVEMKECQ